MLIIYGTCTHQIFIEFEAEEERPCTPHMVDSKTLISINDSVIVLCELVVLT